MNEDSEAETIPAPARLPVKIGFGLVVALVLAWGSPPVGLIAGILFALFLGNPFLQASHAVAKRLLQVCVVLLGFGMNLPVVLRVGANGSIFAALSIGATLLLGFWMGSRLSLNRKTTALISVGTAICGGSAIAAVGSVIAVTESEIAVAIGTVFLLNAAALYLFPLIGHALHLSQSQFGLWSGIAIHDISSVIGAAMSYGTSSLETATAVKLSRTLWIVPVTLGLGVAFGELRAKRAPAVKSGGGKPKPEACNGNGERRPPACCVWRRAKHFVTPFSSSQNSGPKVCCTNYPAGRRIEHASRVWSPFHCMVPAKKSRVAVPWFIGFFLLASLMRSFVPALANWGAWISHVSHAGMTLVLFLIGAALSPRSVRSLGWRAALLGITLWVFISVTSLAAIRILGLAP